MPGVAVSSGNRVQPIRTLPIEELARATRGTLTGGGGGVVEGITHDSPARHPLT